jgi:hypothetical protein
LDDSFIDMEGYRPCNNLRGMSFEALRKEAKRFHEVVDRVQNLRRVRGLAAWE